jgi:hypothetical protein
MLFAELLARAGRLDPVPQVLLDGLQDEKRGSGRHDPEPPPQPQQLVVVPSGGPITPLCWAQ